MNEGKYVSVATKVSTWVWARLNAIAEKCRKEEKGES